MEPLGCQKLIFIPIISLVIIIFISAANAQCESPSCISLQPAMAPHMEPVASPGPDQVPSPAPTQDLSLDILSVPLSNAPSLHSNPSSLYANQLSVKEPGLSNSLSDHQEFKNICDNTDYPSLCLSSISPPLNGKFDPASVLEMAIKASTEETESVISIISEMASAPDTPPQKVTIFNDCKSSYSDALDNFKSAMDALPARDVGTMNSMLSAAITDYGDCDDVFIGQDSPMSVYSEKLTHMVSNCLAIASLI